MKSWELEAEKMKERNLIKRGKIVPLRERLRFGRKAYRLLMEMHSKEYWESATCEGGAFRGVRAVRARIRAHCKQKARELIKPAVSLREHRQVIWTLKAQLADQHKATMAAFQLYKEQRGPIARPAPEAPASVETEEDKEHRLARERREKRREERREKDLAMLREIRQLKREVYRREHATAA